eukprot:11629218-Alexandrium_andersonii.AAC.1
MWPERGPDPVLRSNLTSAARAFGPLRAWPLAVRKDARYELEDLEVAIEGEEKAMQEALQVLEQAGANVDAAKKALEAA